MAGRRLCVCVLAASGVCEPEVGHTALVGSFATSQDQPPPWMCGWRDPQPGTVSSEDGLVCRAWVNLFLLGDKVGLGQKLEVIGKGAGGGGQRGRKHLL